MRRKIWGIPALLLLLNCVPGHAQQQQLQAFPVSSVRLLDGPFKRAQQTDMKYILALDADKLLAPYLEEAGLPAKTKSYGNWENSGLNGHIGGHYLSALSYMYASTGNKELLKRLQYMLSELNRCQQKNGNGYIGGVPKGRIFWQNIADGKIDAGTFSLNGQWVPFYNIHKVYAGLIDAYKVAGQQQARPVLIKFADWLVQLTANLSDEQIQTILRNEHGGMNDALAQIAEITGDNKYLVLAKRFSHRAILNPLLHQKDSLTGLHANTQIPKVIGFLKVANLDHDTAWANAANFFWNTVTTHRTVSFGGNSVREHFNPVNNFTSMLEDREGPETCNSYNMLKLTKQLFLTHPSSTYTDFYERGLYNHILSSQNTEGGFVYFTPIRPNHYRVYSQPQMGFWCCVGTGMENHGRYGEMIYAHNDRDVYVNLFMASTLNWTAKGLTLTQNTTFPYSDASVIKVKLSKPQSFAIYLRHPSWVNKGEMKVLVNGAEQPVKVNANGYIAVNRKWKTGDVIKLVVPMRTTVEQLPDGTEWVSFVHGPVVLAAATDTANMKGLFADGSRMGHVASGPLYPMDQAPLIVTDNKDLSTAVKPVNADSLQFSVANAVYQEKYKNLKLVPFYTLQNTRYVIYWPYTSTQGLAAKQKEVKEREAAMLALDAITVDKITAGEQQPESDHGFKGDKTWTGANNDQHFRAARGWFSYQLKNTTAAARKLRISYKAPKGSAYELYLNGEIITVPDDAAASSEKINEITVPLPEKLFKQLSIEIKFVAKQSAQTPDIYEVRLLN